MTVAQVLARIVVLLMYSAYLDLFGFEDFMYHNYSLNISMRSHNITIHCFQFWNAQDIIAVNKKKIFFFNYQCNLSHSFVVQYCEYFTVSVPIAKQYIGDL